MAAELNRALSSTAALRVEQAFTQVATAAEFWKAYCDHGYVASGASDRICGEVEALFDAAKAMLKAKTASPLDPVEPSTTFIEAHATLLATIVELEAEPAAFTRPNPQIQAVKDANAPATQHGRATC